MGTLRTTGNQNGFTFLELSIVLAIVGVVTGLGLVTLTASLQASQVNTSVARMNAIEAALLNFGTSFKRLPCPASLTIAPGAANYGVEAASNGGTCYGGTPSATSKWADNAVEGAVPTRALKLPDSYMYDSFGHRFRYAVDPFYTTAGTLPAASGGCSATSSSAITVNDSSGAARTTSGLYVLLSHGRNGHGAYSATGASAMFNGGSTNANELQNCHCTSGASGTVTSSGTAALYVEQAPTQTTTGSNITGFDDIVDFRENWQIQGVNAPLPVAPSCNVLIGSADGEPGMMVYSATPSSYLKSITSTIFAPQGGTTYIKVDSSGNIWNENLYWQGIEEDNSAGSYVKTIPAGGTGGTCNSNGYSCTTGTGLGLFKYPGGFAIDPSGSYIWVTDTGNQRLEEFSTSSGTYIQTFPATCAGVACTKSAVPGQFHFDSQDESGITFDGAGNMWVADSGNNRVQEFSVSGNVVTATPLQIIPATGCTLTGTAASCSASGTTGRFSDPKDVVFDAGGSLWVSEYGGQRISAFNISGTTATYLAKSVAPGNNGCVKGSVFSAEQIAFDKTGNLWVADYGCNRAQEWNVSGTAASVVQIIPSNCFCTGSGCFPAGCTNGNPPNADEPQGIAFPTR